MRIRTNSAKYIAKLQNLGSFNRTSKFILQWTSNQRLKKDSPVGVLWKRGLLDFNIEPCIPFSCLTPNTSLDRVSFNDQLLYSAPNHTQHPEMMRQLSLELININPSQALVLYTDGSKSDSDNCSVFRSELLAIREALNFALHFENSDIYILTDSKSSIQYLKNWPEIREKTGQEVISKIATLSQKCRVCFQWIPSHVGVFGNEEADVLAKEGSALPSATSSELFTSEIYSIHKAIANSAWRNPPTHDCYAGNRPGLSLQSVEQDPLRLHWPATVENLFDDSTSLEELLATLRSLVNSTSLSNQSKSKTSKPRPILTIPLQEAVNSILNQIESWLPGLLPTGTKPIEAVKEAIEKGVQTPNELLEAHTGQQST
ncbi:hypothetical protein AVEN_257106-1 [Araneus ventricosus]|uniref:ribonuclease H n=1 Tax=Araneus ventricosus TaxID=182803 RepID=A0A4Y2FUX0_ARAVE|nr:hypothetical protein AVEN_257106-1 [Araneus ventricosus]